MGGQEGARGYLIQAMVAVLNSFVGDWASVSLEPDTENDKVDIKWADQYGEITSVCQVKSSVNNFGKNEALAWISELIDDAPNSSEYKLILFGTANGPTTKFFRKIKNTLEEDLPASFSHLYPLLKKIEIDLKTLDLSLLEGAIISSVLDFMSKRNIILDHSTIRLIANGLENQYMKFSTKGELIPRHRFEDTLLEWVRFNYADYLDIDRNEITIQFYGSNQLGFTDELNTEFKIMDIRTTEFVVNRSSKLESIVSEIMGIELERSDPVLQDFKRGPGLRLPDLHKTRLVEMSESTIAEIREKYQEVNGTQLTDDFFDTGNLKIQKNTLYNHSTYLGTNSEKKKRELLLEFKSQLFNLIDLLHFWDTLREYRLIPLVVTNRGKVHNEDIDIQVRIPREISVLMPDQFPIPERAEILDLLIDDIEINRILSHQNDSQIKKYSGRRLYPLANPIASVLTQSEEERSKGLKRQFQQLINYTFDYQVFYDLSEFHTFQFTLENLKPNETIGFPAYFLVRSKKDFFIDYSIISKSLRDKINGRVLVS